MQAAGIKGGYPIAYADAFAVALAIKLKAAIVTGDSEFRSVEKEAHIIWL